MNALFHSLPTDASPTCPIVRAIVRPALLLMALTGTANAQFGGENVITTQTWFVGTVTAADLDNDGDQDVLSASMNDNKIAWYENLGTGAFGPQQLIWPNALFARDVFAVDLNGDGELDVLTASRDENKIAWHENLGSGSFGPQIEISDQALGAVSVYAEDLDCDGDMDVLSASRGDDKIAWYENLGSATGTFGLQKIITTQAVDASEVFAIDLDGDMDPDVLSASRGDDKIAWYENLGSCTGTFGPQRVITTQALWARSVHAVDLDGDTDPDVLSASRDDDKIAWYENLGGGMFGPQLVITDQADGALSVHTADLDGDGQEDVLAASRLDNTIAWYKNSGLGSFGPEQVITDQALGATDVFAADLDGDTDLDVLSAAPFIDTVAWYENLHILGTAYCSSAVPNSTGTPGLIELSGESATAANNLTLVASQLPVDQFGYFLTSQTQGFFNPPGSVGFICLGGDIGRYNGNVGQGPTFSLLIDLTSMPVNPPVAVQPGETWNFQAWYRDIANTNNFTDAVSVGFH